MKQRLAQLTHHFRQQQQFSDDYSSPNYLSLQSDPEPQSGWLDGRPIFGTMASIINTNFVGFIHMDIRCSGCRE